MRIQQLDQTADQARYLSIGEMIANRGKKINITEIITDQAKEIRFKEITKGEEMEIDAQKIIMDQDSDIETNKVSLAQQTDIGTEKIISDEEIQKSIITKNAQDHDTKANFTEIINSAQTSASIPAQEGIQFENDTNSRKITEIAQCAGDIGNQHYARNNLPCDKQAGPDDGGLEDGIRPDLQPSITRVGP